MIPVLLSMLLLVAQDERAAPTLTLAPPVVATAAGAVVPIGVYFRNGGTTPLQILPPAQIDAEIVTTQARSPISLVRMGEWAEGKPVAPGESLFVEYSLDLPPEIAGRVVIQLARLAAAPAVLDIERSEPAGLSTTPTVLGSPSGSDQIPLDPEAVPPPPATFQYAEGALQRFRAYEPMYFLGGTDRPNVRFQFSFQYQIFNPEGPWVSSAPFLAGLFIGYSQTGLWDLEGESKPFTDTNYKPELAWSKDQIEWLKLPGVAQTGLQVGVQHESNGGSGDQSRSINIAYVRPVLHFGYAKGFGTQFAPKIYAYLPDVDDNPDIADYRGYCDLRLSAGWKDGFQAAATGRLGSGGDNGSIQIDLTFPLRSFGDGNFDLFLQLQWFSGYGESLISYDRYTDALRLGIGFVR